MADCPSLAACIFFNDKMADMPATAGRYKDQYCRNDFAGCARYIVRQALGKEKVPANLTPNATKRAQEIIQLAGTEAAIRQHRAG